MSLYIVHVILTSISILQDLNYINNNRVQNQNELDRYISQAGKLNL